MNKFTKMGKKKEWLGIVLFALALTGCGKAKMDAKTALETLESVKAAQENPMDHTPRSVSLRAGVEVGDEIEFMGKPCQLITPKYDTGGNVDHFNQQESGIGGDQCPVEWRQSEDFSDPHHIKNSLHFSARTAEAKKLMDVDSMDVTTELSPSDDGKKATFKFSMKGHSQAKGDLALDMEGQSEGSDQRNFRIEWNGSLTVADKVAELKLVQVMKDGQDSEEAFINGEKQDERGTQVVAGTSSTATGAKGKRASVFFQRSP